MFSSSFYLLNYNFKCQLCSIAVAFFSRGAEYIYVYIWLIPIRTKIDVEKKTLKKKIFCLKIAGLASKIHTHRMESMGYSNIYSKKWLHVLVGWQV